MNTRVALVALHEAGRAMLRRKVQNGLATLGITIGIAAVVMVVAVGQAGTARAMAELEKLGDNLVWIEAGGRTINGVRTGSHGTSSLTVEDMEAIAAEVPLLKSCAPQVDGTVQVIGGQRNWNTRYRGASPEYLDIKRFRVAEGAPFSAEDVRQYAGVVVIGPTVRDKLFGSGDAVGATVRINGQLFQVLGVLAAKGQSSDGRDQDDWIFLPYTTAERRLRGGPIRFLDDILCSAVTPQSVNPAIDRINALMRQRHHIAAGQEDDFNIRRPDEVLKAQVQASDTLAALLLAVALVSLLVGGVGIMNVMLASVAQRTAEVGLRMAVGAPGWAVRVQFLGESLLLSLAGATGGVLLSAVSSFAFEKTVGWPIAVSLRAVLVAVAAAAVVGMLSGLYPAWKASRLDPIEALRAQ